MKTFSLCLAAAALLLVGSGCASEDGGHYTPSQVYAQHSSFEPTERVSNTRY